MVNTLKLDAMLSGPSINIFKSSRYHWHTFMVKWIEMMKKNTNYGAMPAANGGFAELLDCE